MNLKEFINENYDGFKKFTWGKLERWWNMHLLDLECEKEINNFEDIRNYELQKGDIIGIASNYKTFNAVNAISYKDLEKAQSEIDGLGNAGLKNIKKVLGNVFTLKDIENNIDNIGYLGEKTFKNIRDYFG